MPPAPRRDSPTRSPSSASARRWSVGTVSSRRHLAVGAALVRLGPGRSGRRGPGGGAAETAGRPWLCRHRDHGGGLCRLPSGARVAAGRSAAEARPRPWGAGASRPARRRSRADRRIAGRCSVKADERTPFGCQMTGALRTTCVHSLFAGAVFRHGGPKLMLRHLFSSLRGISCRTACAHPNESWSSCSRAIRCESGSANSSFTFTL